MVHRKIKKIKLIVQRMLSLNSNELNRQEKWKTFCICCR